MNWTKNPPAAAGWYWWRSANHAPSLVRVHYSGGMECFMTVVPFAGGERHCRASEAGGEWLGPVSPDDVAAEREACAALVESLKNGGQLTDDALQRAADAIRGRGEGKVMADRTSARLFGEVFTMLADYDPAEQSPVVATCRAKMVRWFWDHSGRRDFHPCQMDCNEALEKLGLARRRANPEPSEEPGEWEYGPEGEG